MGLFEAHMADTKQFIECIHVNCNNPAVNVSTLRLYRRVVLLDGRTAVRIVMTCIEMCIFFISVNRQHKFAGYARIYRAIS